MFQALLTFRSPQIPAAIPALMQEQNKAHVMHSLPQMATIKRYLIIRHNTLIHLHISANRAHKNSRQFIDMSLNLRLIRTAVRLWFQMVRLLVCSRPTTPTVFHLPLAYPKFTPSSMVTRHRMVHLWHLRPYCPRTHPYVLTLTATCPNIDWNLDRNTEWNIAPSTDLNPFPSIARQPGLLAPLT